MLMCFSRLSNYCCITSLL